MEHQPTTDYAGAEAITGYSERQIRRMAGAVTIRNAGTAGRPRFFIAELLQHVKPGHEPVLDLQTGSRLGTLEEEDVVGVVGFDSEAVASAMLAIVP